MLGYTPAMDAGPEPTLDPLPQGLGATHHVYIVRCADGSLYTGYAVDIPRRVDAHNTGRGARYTAGRRPVGLVFRESFTTRGAALSREHQIKQLSRAQKEALIASYGTPQGEARRRVESACVEPR